ncbi:MAG: hypothetical protein ACLP1Y_10610 [Candidatus Acidiferrales bacterium]
MTVDEFAEVLRNADTQLVEKGWYEDQFFQKGYWAELRLGSWWYSFSVSNTEVEIAADEVAAAISSEERKIIRAGVFLDRKGEPGFSATVQCAEHRYMLSTNNTGEDGRKMRIVDV